VRGGKAAVPAQQKLKPLSEDRFGVRFTADAEFKRLLEEVRALASHRRPNADLLSLMKQGLEAYRRELLKERYGVGSKARRTKRMSVNSSELASGVWKRSRRVSAAVAREVYLRDGGCCTFSAANGQRCGARRFLEIDHVTPWAEHGESTVENLRLRCRAHNQHAAREYFGAEYVRARVAAHARRNSG
jgi:5-methylcytosine-specific restriction endonuclease McrA